jgi:hypothetical protein
MVVEKITSRSSPQTFFDYDVQTPPFFRYRAMVQTTAMLRMFVLLGTISMVNRVAGELESRPTSLSSFKKLHGRGMRKTLKLVGRGQVPDRRNLGFGKYMEFYLKQSNVVFSEC